MAGDYDELIRDAMQQPIPDIPLPAHLIDNAEATLVSVLGHVRSRRASRCAHDCP